MAERPSKKGKTRNGKQRYLCQSCGKTFLTNHSHTGCKPFINEKLLELTKEGVGIRSISRIQRISPSTVINKTLSIAQKLKAPIQFMGQKYEVDEMCSYVGRKDKYIWIAYAFCRQNKKVSSFYVGKRTHKTLKRVVNRILPFVPKEIHPDGLKAYKFITPSDIYRTKKNGTNRIENKNTSLGTHLKRLNRRTICYSKSIAMLVACLKIYFRG